MPKVSVVMPAYNAEKTIANAINSILNQTMEDWELIVVDDCSTDRTLDIVRFFQAQDSRISWWRFNEHKGLVEARNWGNGRAEASIIAVQDADDLSMPDRLEKCLKALKKADIVYHGAYINMWDTQYNCIGRKYIEAPKFDLEKLKQSQYITGWPVFKKFVWEKFPYRLETQFSYDWAQYIDWAYNGFTFKALDEGLYEYVRHENSASIQFEKDGRRQKSFEEIKKLIQKYEPKN